MTETVSVGERLRYRLAWFIMPVHESEVDALLDKASTANSLLDMSDEYYSEHLTEALDGTRALLGLHTGERDLHER